MSSFSLPVFYFFVVGVGAPFSPPCLLLLLLFLNSPHLVLLLSGPPGPALPATASPFLLHLSLLLLLPGDPLSGSGRPEFRGAGRASGSLHGLLTGPDVRRGADGAPQPGRHPDGGGGRRGGVRPPVVLWSLKDQQQEEQLQHG